MGSGSLTVPAPPPAAADVLTVVSGLADGLPKAPDGAVMAAQEGGVRLLRAGPVPRFGKGDDARTAPAGQTLLAFTYEDIAGQYGSAPMQVSLAVSGVPVRTVPSLAAGEAVVVAVPAKASADLVLKADGLTQTLAVPSGRPGAGNVAVLARSHRQAPLKVSQPLTVALGPGAPIQGSLTATEAVLGYWARAGQNHAASTDRAYLTVDLSFSAPNQAQALAIDAALLTLTPTGGSPMKAVDLDPSDQVYAAFEVPADFTGGVITVGGSETTPAGLTLAISQPVNVPIGFQAG
jgi:hypothetical protein